MINDAYNANPTRCAPRSTRWRHGGRRRVAVLGPMAELDDPGAAHREVAAPSPASSGIEVIADGTDRYGSEPVDRSGAAVGAIGAGDAVLVKASRVAGLERVAVAAVALC